MEIIEMENRWKDPRWKSIEMKDKWKDHGWKAWKWSVTRLTLHSAKPELAKVAKVWSSFRQPEFYLAGQIAKPELGKVDSYLSSETECIQKIYCRKNFTEPSLWHLTTTPEHFEDAIWKSVGQYLAGFLVSVNTFATFPTGSERDLGKCKTPHTHEQNCSISFNTLNTFPTVSKGEREGEGGTQLSRCCS